MDKKQEQLLNNNNKVREIIESRRKEKELKERDGMSKLSKAFKRK